jgi:hypothetical protein
MSSFFLKKERDLRFTNLKEKITIVRWFPVGDKQQDGKM